VCHSQASGLLGKYDSVEDAEWTARLLAIAAGVPNATASSCHGSPAIIASSCYPIAPTRIMHVSHMHPAATKTCAREEQQHQAKQQLPAASAYSAADVVTSMISRSSCKGSELEDRTWSLFASAVPNWRSPPNQSRHHSRTKSACRRNPAIRALALESALAEQKSTFRREALRNLWLREKAMFQELVRGNQICSVLGQVAALGITRTVFALM
jgi:hypothetical protein